MCRTVAVEPGRAWSVLWAALLVGIAFIACPPPSIASHLIKVVEVFPGTVTSPNSQYVVLQMYFSGQNVGLNGATVEVFDSNGGSLGVFTFTADVAIGNDQSKILIATTQATTFFGVTANLTMTPVIRAAGGKVCYSLPVLGTIDCVAWGNYRGSSTGVGTPFHPPPGTPSVAGVGLEPGRALARRLDLAGSPTFLDFGDDTNDSANDFRLATPAPRNNAAQNGTVPPSTCGNGVLEGLEQCDDHNTVGGDACSPTCQFNTGTVGVDPSGSDGLADRLLASPNPFRERVSVLFALPRAEVTVVGVYDLLGRRVRGLHQGALDAGAHRFDWDGRDDEGAVARAGFYIMRVRSSALDLSARLVRIE